MVAFGGGGASAILLGGGMPAIAFGGGGDIAAFAGGGVLLALGGRVLAPDEGGILAVLAADG